MAEIFQPKSTSLVVVHLFGFFEHELAGFTIDHNFEEADHIRFVFALLYARARPDLLCDLVRFGLSKTHLGSDSALEALTIAIPFAQVCAVIILVHYLPR